ncbi:MAG: AAA family ATPase [Blastochloris sp.]|nr:AAA family ATPase [Blastochloris sp.]
MDGQIIMVIGAPGVGKTTVRKAMVRDLTTQFLAQPELHPGHLPVAGSELEAFGGGNFKWKQTRQALLRALHEPQVDKIVWYSTTMEGEHAVLQRSTRLTSDDLGELLLTVLAQRQPQALRFDEGQHLIKVAGARGLLDQLDVLKSLANRSHIPTILFETYEMNVLLGLSPQLDRRIFRIHIPRYHATQPADVTAFQQVLFGLQKHLPFPEEPQLVEDWEYFFTGPATLSCTSALIAPECSASCSKARMMGRLSSSVAAMANGIGRNASSVSDGESENRMTIIPTASRALTTKS